MASNAKFYFKPGEGSHIETRVTLRAEAQPAIGGTVTSDGGAPVSDALVLLLRAGDKSFIDRQLTDEDGQFFFGPLEAGELYLVKIHKSGTPVRELVN
ncbi:MAG: carboxypeptidase-like regulatory domain-containing protein [Oscillospiraceae bacterium]|nr:carboxypeptidase-like regulatory domain-containing protein [Oscillospiraceae bacterium]